MKETWLWFGPLDRLSLPEVAQMGAVGIVTALHEVPYGEVWEADTIAARNDGVKAAGFAWDVVESLPVHEAIKRGKDGLGQLLANCQQSMTNLAANGVRTICDYVMPLLDWARTDLAVPVARGGTCLRFEAAKMAAFEVFMVEREGAADDYGPAVLEQAEAWYTASGPEAHAQLLNVIMSCLPRIVSNAQDIQSVFAAFDAPENGLTLGTGSLGASPANNLPSIVQHCGDRIHFVHLRNVTKDPDGLFEEATLMDGDTDKVAELEALLEVERRRETSIPFRPNHGHALLDDRQWESHPGYPLFAPLRGLAKLPRVVIALSRNNQAAHCEP